MSKRIIGVDFSKVLSPVGISQFVTGELAKHLTIDQASIRTIYKSNIGKLVTNQRSITTVISELEPFLHEGKTTKDISTIFSSLPPIDKDFLVYLQSLRKNFDIYIISDIYQELGEQLKKELHDKFDGFFLSYEFGKKKSDVSFWKELPITKIVLFIDDKQEITKVTEQVGIDSIVYDSFEKQRKHISASLPKLVDTIILGGGASGIMYAHKLQEINNTNFTVLEKEGTAGGLMQSFKLGESRYDIGGHALHDSNKKIKKFLEKHGIKHYKQKRKAYIDYDGKFIPFPFQLHLKYLDKEKRKECLDGFLKAYTNEDQHYGNLKEYLINKFGVGIYKHFLGPYNKKIWKTDLESIATNRSERISREDIDTFLLGYLKKNEDNYGTNQYVNYPTSGGYQSYLQPFIQNSENHIQYNTEIKAIDTEKKRITTNRGNYYYNKAVSTIPVNQLITLASLPFSPSKFEYLSLFIVAFEVKKLNEVDMQRIYNASSKYFFHKCVINSNSSRSLKKKDKLIITFEMSFRDKSKDPDEYIRNCIKYLKSIDLIKHRNDITGSRTHTIKYAYPIQTNSMIKERKKLDSYLQTQDFYLLGRFGHWEYINFDKVIEGAFALFEEIQPGT